MLDIETEQEIASFKLPPASLISSVDSSADSKTVVFLSNTEFTFWDFDLENLLERSCNIVHDYLKNNPNVNESERHLCDSSH